MKTFARLAFPLALAGLVAAIPNAADAAVKRLVIRPNDLAPFVTQQADTRYGVFNSAPELTLFWKELQLPAGAKIRSMRYRRLASAANPTVVGIDRVNPGKTPAWQRILQGTGTDISSAGSIGTIVTASPMGVSRKVTRGWSYFVLVSTESCGAGVGDIPVVYSTP